MSEIKRRRLCTCTGSCRGKESLGEGWVCALESTPEKILEAALDLKEAITDAKSKLLLALEGAVKVGYHMRQAQKNYYAARSGKQELLMEAKRLEGAFDRRLAELKALGVDFNE